MKKYLSYLGFTIATIAAFSSCMVSDDLWDDDLGSATTLTLTLPDLGMPTRATSDGLGRFNENVIRSVDLFFYPIGGTASNAVHHVKYTVGNGMSVDNQTHIATLTSKVGINVLRNIFPNYDTATETQSCEVYAIVNLPTNVTIGDNTDLASLKQIELSNPVFGQTNPNNVQISAIPTEFVMSGLSDDNEGNRVTLSSDKRTIQGNVNVYRAASKITLELTGVSPTFTDANGNIWNSETEHIVVSIRHGQTKGYVDAPTTTNVTGDYTLKDIRMIPATENTAVSTTGHYSTDVPFYSYAHNWTTAQSYRTSLLLTVYWKNTNQAGSSFQPTYYEIPINDEDEALIRNTYYKISLKVGVIGSLVEEEPVKMTCSYVILPWGTNETILADLTQVRYLVVDETELNMENIIATSVYFSSSHNIYYANKTLQHRDLHATTAQWEDLDPGKFRVVITNPTKENPTGIITVEHELNNSMNEDGDYTQYKMEFDVYHYDEELATTRYKEHIVVYQEPMIYAEAEMNYNYIRYLNGQTNNYNDQRGYMWVNNGQGSYGGQNGISSNAGNKNPNRYIIKATALTSNEYVIGDPRTSYINNNLTNATIGYEQSNTYNWSYTTTTTDLDVAESWGRYTEGTTTQTVAGHYGTYQEYQEHGGYRQSDYITNTNNIPSGVDWSQHTSEANAYVTLDGDNDPIYWWRVRNNGSYRYYYAYYYIYAYYTTVPSYSNTLMYYHPTDETERTENMIAPEFMIASSYGVTSDISKEAARKRCASYQEDGYPAGRWRLPTQAEVMYIVQLSAWGIIPHLFGYVTTNNDGTVTGSDRDAPYWSANGQIMVNAGKGTARVYNSTSNTAVRCVYDTWFWGRDEDDKCDRTQYTWGDEDY